MSTQPNQVHYSRENSYHQTHTTASHPHPRTINNMHNGASNTRYPQLNCDQSTGTKLMSNAGTTHTPYLNNDQNLANILQSFNTRIEKFGDIIKRGNKLIQRVETTHRKLLLTSDLLNDRLNEATDLIFELKQLKIRYQHRHQPQVGSNIYPGPRSYYNNRQPRSSSNRMNDTNRARYARTQREQHGHVEHRNQNNDSGMYL